MTPRSSIANLIAAIATVASADIALGFTLQLLPVLMEHNGVSASLIGLNTAMSPLGILLAGPVIPRIVQTYGTRRVAAIAIAVSALSLIGFKLSGSILFWFPLRFVLGISAGALFIVSEAWILTFADPSSRGRVMGIYTSVLSISFSVGPLLLPLTGIDGWLPWLIAIFCLLFAAVPLTFVRPDEELFREDGTGRFWSVAGRVPLLLFAVGCATLFDSVFISFFSIFGLRNGLTLATASSVLGVGILGNLLFQYIVGWLADRWSKRGVVIISALLTVALSVTLIFVVRSWWLWPVVIALSTCAFAVYVVALALIGDRFSGGDLVACSAAFSTMWGVGGLVGPSLAGAAIDSFGINAMPLTLAAFYCVLLAGLAFTGGNLVRTERNA